MLLQAFPPGQLVNWMVPKAVPSSHNLLKFPISSHFHTSQHTFCITLPSTWARKQRSLEVNGLSILILSLYILYLSLFTLHYLPSTSQNQAMALFVFTGNPSVTWSRKSLGMESSRLLSELQTYWLVAFCWTNCFISSNLCFSIWDREGDAVWWANSRHSKHDSPSKLFQGLFTLDYLLFLGHVPSLSSLASSSVNKQISHLETTNKFLSGALLLLVFLL